MLRVQFTSNEGMSNDALTHECESEVRPLHWALRAILVTKSVWKSSNNIYRIEQKYISLR